MVEHRISAQDLSRHAVLAARWQAHGLDSCDGSVDLVLRLGVQDTPYGSAARALVARGAAADVPAGPLVWSWRGAPHLHRPGDLPALAAALWPVSDADATKRIATTSIRQGAKRGVEAFTAAATAMREAVTERLPKGEVSTLVSERVPADLTYDCEPCGSRHVSGALFQQVGLAAGIQVVPQGRSTFLEPLPDDLRPAAVPTAGDGTGEALRFYVELLGPASPAHLAAFLGTTVGVAKTLVPAGLVEVDAPAGPGWTTPEALARARVAPAPRATRPVPPSDPWLQARDREVLVPDPERRKVVWRLLGNAGAVLVDAEVAGVWRATTTRGRFVVTVETFEPPTSALRGEVEVEAQRIAAAGGPEEPGPVEVVFSG